MWKRSRLFKCNPFLCIFTTCMMFWMGPKECARSVKCLAKSEVRLAVLNASLCSRNLVVMLRPVCLTYALPQSGQVSLYIPDLEYGQCSVVCVLRGFVCCCPSGTQFLCLLS